MLAPKDATRLELVASRRSVALGCLLTLWQVGSLCLSWLVFLEFDEDLGIGLIFRVDRGLIKVLWHFFDRLAMLLGFLE